MRRFRAVSIAFMAIFAAPAGAEQSYPDLKGSWAGTGTGAFVTALDFGTKAVPETVDLKLVVDQQQGKHFAGSITSAQYAHSFSGVIKSDGGILLSQPGSFVEARLTGADTMEACYVRISAFNHLATCEELKRQK